MSSEESEALTPFAGLAGAHAASDVRRWARAHGIEVSVTGGLPRFVYELYAAQQGAGEAQP